MYCVIAIDSATITLLYKKASCVFIRWEFKKENKKVRKQEKKKKEQESDQVKKKKAAKKNKKVWSG